MTQTIEAGAISGMRCDMGATEIDQRSASSSSRPCEAAAMDLRADGGIVRHLAAGAVAGTVGTIAMSTLMLAAQRAGLLGEQPPRKLSDAVLDAVAGGADERTRRVGTAVVHLGIGAAAAALHQVGRHRAGSPSPAAVWGGGFGALFWGLNYGLVAPAVGILPPPDRDRPGRAPVMLAANIVWGAVSAVLGDRVARTLTR